MNKKMMQTLMNQAIEVRNIIYHASLSPAYGESWTDWNEALQHIQAVISCLEKIMKGDER